MKKAVWLGNLIHQAKIGPALIIKYPSGLFEFPDHPKPIYLGVVPLRRFPLTAASDTTLMSEQFAQKQLSKNPRSLEVSTVGGTHVVPASRVSL